MQQTNAAEEKVELVISPSERTSLLGTGTSPGGSSTSHAAAATDSGISALSVSFVAALQDAVHHSFGVVAVDVWLMEGQNLVHANNGWYRDPRASCHETKGGMEMSDTTMKIEEQREALSRLEDPTHPAYIPPSPQIPGVGLAGFYWKNHPSSTRRELTWRRIHSISSDPYQPHYERMNLLELAGFGYVTGCVFDLRGHRGVVLYLARESAQVEMLEDEANCEHLARSADLIGALSALLGARGRRLGNRKRRVEGTFGRARKVLEILRAFASSGEGMQGEGCGQMSQRRDERRRGRPLPQRAMSVYNRAHQSMIVKADVFASKCHAAGGAVQPPSRMVASELRWTFVGSFLTFCALVALKDIMYNWTGELMILGPFGASICLQQALTQAPPAQPRDALYGQTVSFVVSVAVKNIAIHSGVPFWLHAPLGTSLSITAMAGLGILHPPAGAMSWIIMTNGDFRPFVELNVSLWVTFFLCILGNVIAIIVAVICNNLNSRRQYPIYWRLCWW
ncbi:hypothetical protein ACHAXR_011932 [Thalassiosira sp. AJA248-18]